MLESYVRLKPAIVHTLLSHDAPVEFSNADWQLMEKLVKVLRPFVDATEMLSTLDASISMAIPCVTSIIMAMEVSDEDQGVKTMKKDLKKAMEKRFAAMEGNDDYAVATLLDSKYKKHFFRSTDTTERAKNVVVDKLFESLRNADNRLVRNPFNFLLEEGPGKTKCVLPGPFDNFYLMIMPTFTQTCVHY